MAEPGNIPPVPPVPPGGSPFNPNAPAAPRPGPGCSKPLLIGCGALVLVVGICVVFLVLFIVSYITGRRSPPV